MLLVVGAALLDGEGRVLAARRAGPGTLAGWWEFPGGKVEGGEEDAAALVRECREELGIEVAVGEPLGSVPLQGGDGVLRVYLGRVLAGTPTPLVHGELRWLAAGELDGVPWLPADLPLVGELRRHLGAAGRRRTME